MPPSFSINFMKKYILFIVSLLLIFPLFAETVKLKDGTFVSGSITSQTEYTLNVRTSYGPVILNQREVEAILPDKHRIFLKGGTQLIGVITDLDEFNLKLQTEDGVVNIDMPQIVSIEVYDYEQGDAAQKTIQEHQAAQEVATGAAVTTVGVGAAATGAESTAATDGLSFDADIEKAFDAKKPEIVNGQVQTVREISAADIRAKQAAAMSDEEAFLKGITPTQQEQIEQTAQAARSGQLEKMKKAQAEKAKRPKDANSNKFFSVSVGAQTNNLKLDNSEKAGFAKDDIYDVGGTSVRAEATFMWRLKSSNFWLGPSLAIANISKSSFEDKDPAIKEANDAAQAAGRPLPYPPGSNLNVETSGQMIDILLKGTYYFNPDSRFSVYATASGGYRFLTLNYRGVIQADTLNTGTVLGAAGLGIQTYIDDLLIGLEVTEHFSPYSNKFKKSSVANTVAAVTFSWKF